MVRIFHFIPYVDSYGEHFFKFPSMNEISIKILVLSLTGTEPGKRVSLRRNCRVRTSVGLRQKFL